MISPLTPAPIYIASGGISKPDEEPDALSEVGGVMMLDIVVDIVVVGDMKLNEELDTFSEGGIIVLDNIMVVVGDTKLDEPDALSELGRVRVVVGVIVFVTRPIVVSLL